ncbi:MAG: hypothetical protein ACTHJR_17285, partial [Sphingomonas sp.]|uniref:hypothetical protein n=1 Tax=Sphingomonas sp. TaxID=28214 RepID=UPI003F7E1D40
MRAGISAAMAMLVALASPAMAQVAPAPATPVPPSVAVAVAEPEQPCRVVADVPSIRIDPAAAARLAEIGLDRAAIFARMHETSVPETS